MKPVGVPKFIRRLYPERIWDVPTNKKEVFLTFDDGPIPEVTPWVLEQLHKYQAKATFFCIGDNIVRNPEIFKQILASGHRVGNHTQNHLKGWHTGLTDYLQNVDHAQQVMLEQGYRDASKLFRPPYGKMTSQQGKKLLEQNYAIVMWSILSYDYDAEVSREKCLKNVLDNVQNGSIVVFHDSLKAERSLRYVLPRILEELQGKGYSFKAL